jgi:NADP-dependent aldehyde dehydrogenase
MTINGNSLIGSQSVHGAGKSFRGLAAATGQPIEPAFGSAQPAEVDRACRLAAQAFDVYRETRPAERAAFLELAAQKILDLGDELIERACAESGLPRPRIEGERGRTIGQLKLFAKLVREGDWIGARIDPALPGRSPMPRPDLRMRRIAVGPVAVFGASNFPLAFSVAGGDTASALAAGCPVVVKAHPAHPGTSELVGQALQAAVRESKLPEGVFSMLFDAGYEVGAALAQHPAIMAVGFTGSRKGGLALMDLARQRPEPIPVYAEMSSVNPVFVLPAALAARGEKMAQDYVDSLTLGTGQFCTNPGLLLAVKGPELERFVATARTALGGKPAAVMLTQGIAAAYAQGVQAFTGHGQAKLEARGGTADGAAGWRAQPALFSVDGQHLLDDDRLEQEVFGPSSVIVACDSVAQMVDIAGHLEGQLTATLQIDAGDYDAAAPLVRVLERKAGRVLANAFPTGVEVGDAMVHGGPFPATSDSRTTSVGTAAIERFLRPVCYQDLPEQLLPEALRDSDPFKIARRVDGKLQAPA